MAWYKPVISKLEESGLFIQVRMMGGKIRASMSETRFLDIHFDPTRRSYSYALIDLDLPYSGDKRVFGWDDYPHEGIAALKQLADYPHHFQKRAADGSWLFEPSPMRGHVIDEVDDIIVAIKCYLANGS